MVNSIQGKEMALAATGLWLSPVLRGQPGGTTMTIDRATTVEGKP